MTTNYEAFLNVAEDGRIWWRLEDAIKLAAGYVPRSDVDENLVPVLRAPNQGIKVNERTLIGAFSDKRIIIHRPDLLDRDGVHFVDAELFLDWLVQYLTLTQCDMPLPVDLFVAVQAPLANAGEVTPVLPKKPFESLTLALDGWFDKSLDELPVALRQRVEKELGFHALWEVLKPEERQRWDNLKEEEQRMVAITTANNRRNLALARDYNNDPATEQDRQSRRDSFLRMVDLDKAISEWESVATPVASDLAQKEARLVEFRQERDRMKRRLQERADYYPGRIVSAGRGALSTSPIEPVSAALIREHFRVLRDADANDEWWKTNMRDAKRNGLTQSRVGDGQKGQGGGSLWRPDLIAGWLVDRQGKSRQGLSANAARTALKKFAGCEEIAIAMFPDDK